MIKKIMFMIGLGFCISTYTFDDNYTMSSHGNNVVVAAAAAVVAGTGLYWMYREPNASKIERANAVCSDYGAKMRALLVEIETIQDLYIFNQQALEFTVKINQFDERVSHSYQEISKRYNSWVTPWNHTLTMQKAYNAISDIHQQWMIDVQVARAKIKYMSDMLKAVMESLQAVAYFAPLMAAWHSFADEVDMAKFARKLCQGASVYPISTSIIMLQNALHVLHKTRAYVACDQSMLDKMEQMRIEMLSSVMYLDEKRAAQAAERAEQEIALQRRLVQAEEEKARAEKQQAYAQQQQARAQEEQAAAQREHNRIEREKLNKNNKL